MMESIFKILDDKTIKIIVFCVVFSFIIGFGIAIYKFFFTNEGFDVVQKVVGIENKEKASSASTNDSLNINNVQNMTINISIEKLKERNIQKQEEVFKKQNEHLAKLINMASNTYDHSKLSITEKIKQENIRKLILQIKEDSEKLNNMIKGSHTVISKGVHDVVKNDLSRGEYKKEFLEANLDLVKQLLNEATLKNILDSEGKEAYAKQLMLKSMSNYIDFEPNEAVNSYNKAKQIYPSLQIIQDLFKEYKSLEKSTLKYAYVLVASVAKNNVDLVRSADYIVGLGNAENIRKKGYNLYLNVNNSEIRVHTIIEHYTEGELETKINSIKKYINSPFPFRVDEKYPEEYNLNRTRKKIFVVDSSKRGNDKTFTKKVKHLLNNHNNIEAHGNWEKKFGIYAIYYDGNSYDKIDLDKVLEATRKVVGSYVVKAYAYQQSKGERIQELFKNDISLKYLIVLEKNTNLSPI